MTTSNTIKNSKFAPLFDPERPNVTKMLEPHSGLLFWDEQKKVYYEQYRKLTGQFWIPHEISLRTDSKDWQNNMSDDEKELFKRGISQLVLLDSLATVSDGFMASYIQNTAIRTLLFYISSQEAIHNESYTYICTSFMTKEEADSVFVRPKEDPLVLEATQPIIDAFDDFRNNPSPQTLAFSIAAMVALEGIRFTNGFTPFYYLNRSNKMQGTGTAIGLINRDESQHSYTWILVLRDLLTQYADEIDVSKLEKKTIKLFEKVVGAEKRMVKSFYEKFDDIDVVEVEMYVEWRANSLLSNMGLDKIFETKRNPMRWITVFDPENKNNQRTDFFEKRETNYERADVEKNKWDEL